LPPFSFFSPTLLDSILSHVQLAFETYSIIVREAFGTPFREPTGFFGESKRDSSWRFTPFSSFFSCRHSCRLRRLFPFLTPSFCPLERSARCVAESFMVPLYWRTAPSVHPHLNRVSLLAFSFLCGCLLTAFFRATLSLSVAPPLELSFQAAFLIVPILSRSSRFPRGAHFLLPFQFACVLICLVRLFSQSGVFSFSGLQVFVNPFRVL